MHALVLVDVSIEHELTPLEHGDTRRVQADLLEILRREHDGLLADDVP